MAEIDYHAEKINLIKHENISEPGLHLKSVERRDERKHAWQTELIRVSVLDVDGNERPGCTWRIPRHKLTQEFVQEVINRSPAGEDEDGCMMEFLRDSTGVELIWPQDMQFKCQPKPFSYYIVKKFVNEGYDAKDDVHYTGDLRVMLKSVPLRTSNEKYLVKMEDVRTWVLTGIIEEDSYVQKYVKKARRCEKAIDVISKKIKATANQPMHDDRGNEMTGPKADAEREERYLDLFREKERIEEEHDHTKKEVEIAVKQRIGSRLVLRQGVINEKAGHCTWILQFSGLNKLHFEDLVSSKTDWSGIKLAIGRGERLPYTCRGTLPDGSKPYIPDLVPFSVNMYGVRVERLEDGFGTYQELDRQSSSLKGKRFQFYHGTFQEGKKHGYGVWYTDEGIYTGQISHDQPVGKGRMDYANGDNLTGEFRVSRGHKESLLGPNPYSRGEPNGLVKRTFADGSFYEGEMLDGRLTGQGSYINAMGERYDGMFKNGYFHGQGKLITAVGEVMDGEFYENMLHGYGSYKNSRDDSYIGGFDRGERHGKGMEHFANNNRFIGFYQDGLRLWHGETYYGNVTESIGHRGEVMLSFDCKHEGPWRAGFMRSGGVVTYTATKNAWPSMNKEHPRYPFLSKLKENEEKANKRQLRQKKKMYDVDRLMRVEIERKKTKVFQQQRHLAKKNMYYAEENPDALDEGVLLGATAYRKSRIENMVNKQQKVVEEPKGIDDADEKPGLRMVEAREMKKMVPQLKLGIETITEEINKIGDHVKPRQTILSKLLQSDFEEMEERRRYINLEHTNERINNVVDKMYKQMMQVGKPQEEKKN
jgi:hypothetical protein